jgi:hypothetical protein
MMINRTNRFLAWGLLGGLAALLAGGGWGAQRNRRAEERKLKELNESSERLNRLASGSAVSEEQLFLHERVQELIVRAREIEAGSYLFARLAEAMDDLLDASEELRDARRDRRDDDDDDEQEAQERTARDLEQTYFRVRQGNYFAEQSGDPQGKSYVRLAHRLYQQARAAYDGKRYGQARDLADAAREVIEGLENLAQAAVRIPDPPKL